LSYRGTQKRVYSFSQPILLSITGESGWWAIFEFSLSGE